MQVRSIEGDTLGALLYRELGSDSDALEDAAYRLNPYLAQLPPILPIGTVLQLPDLPAPAPVSVVNVWD